MDEALRRILDLEAIRDVHYRCCRGIDRRDWELVRSGFHPDASDDHGEYVGGVDGLIEYAKAGTLRFAATFHMTGKQLIEVAGDTAWAEHYAIAYHRCPASGGAQASDWIVNARFVDRRERRSGEWRIAHRRLRDRLASHRPGAPRGGRTRDTCAASATGPTLRTPGDGRIDEAAAPVRPIDRPTSEC